MPEVKLSSDRRKLSTFRTHLILTCMTATAVFAVIIALSVFVPLAAHLGRVSIDQEISAGLAEHFLFLHAALWPLIFLSLVACVISAVILYERMRSPMVRFVRYFGEIGEGALPNPLTIRLGDYLTEEADALNSMIDSLRAQAESREAATRRVEAIIEELSLGGVDPILLADLAAAVKEGKPSTSQLARDDR